MSHQPVQTAAGRRESSSPTEMHGVLAKMCHDVVFSVAAIIDAVAEAGCFDVFQTLAGRNVELVARQGCQGDSHEFQHL